MRLKSCDLLEGAEKLPAGRTAGYLTNESNKVLQKDYAGKIRLRKREEIGR